MNNLVGKRFGMLVVTDEIKHGKYRCDCDCGNSIEVWDSFLYGGRSNCGCVVFNKKDLTGRRFGRLMVEGPVVKNRVGRWQCRCDCGTEKIISGGSLNSGSKSCGCLQRETAACLGRKTALDLVGRRFGRLVVVCRDGSKWRKSLWQCRCDCGNIKLVTSRSLIVGGTKSCGCYHKEVWHKLLWNPNLTDEERKLQKERRGDPKTIEWKIKIFNRDNRTCVVCGEKRGHRLVAHHKEAWNSNKEMRYEIANGTTVCRKCHVEFHSLYGYGDNTESEWSEFLIFKSGCVRAKPLRVVRRRKRVNLSGMSFDRLEVVGKDSREYYWICKCNCGVVKSIHERQLVRGKTKSCGCLNRDKIAEVGRKNLKYVAGMRFGKLVVVSRLVGQRLLCRCDCGRERIVDFRFIVNGQAVDCQSSKNGNICSLRRVA